MFHTLKVIENTRLLQQCGADRDEDLQQVIAEAQTNREIDPMLIPNRYQDDRCIEEDDLEQALHMISIINKANNDAYTISTGNLEQRYLDDALQAVGKTERCALLNGEYDRVQFENNQFNLGHRNIESK